MPSWDEFAIAAPDLAERIRTRFEATGLGFLATLRQDGSPRISGIEPAFALGELWLGMMPASLKVRDLQRDPRLALHSGSADKDVRDGDAKITGVGFQVTDPEIVKRYLASMYGPNSSGRLPAGFHLFRVDIAEASFLRPNEGPQVDRLVIDIWSLDRGVRRVNRY